AIRRVVREFAREWGVTVLLSSHNMSEVEGVCDRIAVIHEGRILACGTPRELKEEYGGASLEEVLIKLVGEGA
ncbi:MAG: multidrug ABC transporter ATP-binding protein, partial [Thermoprotei archaeon]